MPDQAGSSRRVTISDVAERAGVSIGIASKTLNGKGKGRADTRHRVIMVAEQLKFAPNQLARGLIEGRAGIIAASTHDLDGLFCGNDQIARGASEMLRQLGRAIPADVAVVGFDNWEPVVLGADPPSTSVDMCLEDIGRKAAELLLDAVAGQQRSGLHTLPCRLVLRDSSGLGQR